MITTWAQRLRAVLLPRRYRAIFGRLVAAGWGFVLLANPASAMELYRETFNGFSAPPGNFNGSQFQSGLAVAFGGDLADWSKSGGGVVHAVRISDPPPPPARDFAVMIWQDNVITLNNAIGGSNTAGQTYTIDFLASPAVYQLAAQVTTPSDGLLVEVLRSDDSVLASHTYSPGDWAGNLTMVPSSFQYVGDGAGDVRLRVGPSNFNSGHFQGAIDELTLTGASSLFAAGFDDFTAPAGNFNGLQFQSGLEVAFGGDLPDWSKSGGGVVHAVNRRLPEPPPSGDFAVMIWQDNVISLNSPIASSNAVGQAYRVDFEASPAVYQAPSQVTSANDGLLVEVLRSDDSVLASHTYLPGDWAGNVNLVPVNFEYLGDGSGDVRLRIGPSNFNSGRFGGTIDNISVSAVPEPNSTLLLTLGSLIVSASCRRRRS